MSVHLLWEDAYNNITSKQPQLPEMTNKEKLGLINDVIKYFEEKEDYLKCKVLYKVKSKIKI